MKLSRTTRNRLVRELIVRGDVTPPRTISTNLFTFIILATAVVTYVITH